MKQQDPKITLGIRRMVFEAAEVLGWDALPSPPDGALTYAPDPFAEK